MKRTNYTVTVHRGHVLLGTGTKFAMNSGIRASEAIVREIARTAGVMYHGGTPHRNGGLYQRTWTGGADVLLATVTRETP